MPGRMLLGGLASLLTVRAAVKRIPLSDGLALPADAVTQTFGVLAVRGAGKSNTAAVMAEGFFDAGLPFVVVDPVGAWYGLRSSSDGEEAGLEVPIFGGRHGDILSAPGPKNSNWNGGRVVASNGYILLKMPGHHLADVRGYVYEHRLVAELKLGRRLLPGEIPHHVNGVKTDNRPENLHVVPSIAHHRREHSLRKDRRAPGEPNLPISCACGCGRELTKFDGTGRPRRFVSGHNMGVARG